MLLVDRSRNLYQKSKNFPSNFKAKANIRYTQMLKFVLSKYTTIFPGSGRNILKSTTLENHFNSFFQTFERAIPLRLVFTVVRKAKQPRVSQPPFSLNKFFARNRKTIDRVSDSKHIRLVKPATREIRAIIFLKRYFLALPRAHKF